MKPNEFEEMKPIIENARLGSYLIIPLKLDEHSLHQEWIDSNCQKQTLTTMDLNEQIKAMFHPDNPVASGINYTIPINILIDEIYKNAADYSSNITNELPLFAVIHKESTTSEIDWIKNQFLIQSLHLSVFHTNVAFLTLGICYHEMNTLLRLINPGYADSISKYYYKNKNEEIHTFSLDEALRSILDKIGLNSFFQTGNSLFLEAFTYNVAIVSERFNHMDTIQQITFNMHRMTPLTLSVSDSSEADVNFVYAVRDQVLKTYRWGTCVSSQTISYVVADSEMNLEKEMQTQAEDGLPIVLLALYEKYTCLHFTELLSLVNTKQMRPLRDLKKQMLEFKAFGTVHPANISCWHNVKMIYQYLVDTNGIMEAIEDINTKITILSEHQNEISSHRTNTIMGLITIFGVVSILASILSIIEILNDGHIYEWLLTLIISLIMIVISWVAYIWEQKR